MFQNPQKIYKITKITKAVNLNFFEELYNRSEDINSYILESLFLIINDQNLMTPFQFQFLLKQLKGMYYSNKLQILSFLTRFQNFQPIHESCMLSTLSTIKLQKFKNWETECSINSVLIFTLEEEQLKVKIQGILLMQKFSLFSKKVASTAKELFFNLLNDEFDSVRILAMKCIKNVYS